MTSIARDSARSEGAKAYVDFKGTGTVAINKSLNFTSLADNGTADYTISFVSDPDSDKYALAALANNTRNSTSWGWEVYHHQQTSSSFRVKTSNTSYTPQDLEVVCITVHGDLA